MSRRNFLFGATLLLPLIKVLAIAGAFAAGVLPTWLAHFLTAHGIALAGVAVLVTVPFGVRLIARFVQDGQRSGERSDTR